MAHLHLAMTLRSTDLIFMLTTEQHCSDELLVLILRGRRGRGRGGGGRDKEVNIIVRGVRGGRGGREGEMYSRASTHCGAACHDGATRCKCIIIIMCVHEGLVLCQSKCQLDKAHTHTKTLMNPPVERHCSPHHAVGGAS